ncbi:MAG: DinB family protein [Gemmatimonadaceae bacterium]|nr:DinB family protein [Gemmatimonadaceae bacterium]
MTAPDRPREAWLRGSVPGVSALLQPVAHALIQALEDTERLAGDLPAADLWARIGGAAPIGFHLRHMTGSLDRLFTYARGESLTDAQRQVLATEKAHADDVGAAELLATLRSAVNHALAQLCATDTATLTDHRAVGRAGAPSTVIGLLVHAGEHTARHAGQVSSTVRILMGLRASTTG